MHTHRRLSAALCGSTALILGACNTHIVDKQPALVIDKVPSPVVHAKPPAANYAPALTVNQYHRYFAQHLTRVNQSRIYEGVPPNPLRAIVVLEVELSRDGEVIEVRPLRVPVHGQEQFKVARESVMRAAPYPKPSITIALGKSKIAVTETWLFDNDGRFQLRSLALPQHSE
jgi:periplasmic protein TonB